ncbi:energy transducer TonB [Microvenator marinus]|uniref:Energy transducer TonB n=2 Tax=Microvenator marinus TaxID=2600177 RepID=A0A5B8XRY4_9DELT|nr:energy transducer TonB [Microvenator marinus]
MDPVNLEGLTMDSMGEAGAFEIKAGTGIKTGKMTTKVVDPSRFGKIKTAEGGTGEGYSKPAPKRTCPATKPVIGRRVKGKYPPEAKRRQIEGAVVALLTVKTNGKVGKVEVISGAGFGLDEAAVEAFKQWTFKPATQNCEPIEYKIRITHDFSLSDY